MNFQSIIIGLLWLTIILLAKLTLSWQLPTNNHNNKQLPNTNSNFDPSMDMTTDDMPDYHNSLEYSKIPVHRYNLTNATGSIPSKFDARIAWPKCTSIGLIRNQGKCGSCWAVSVSSVISDRICIATNGRKNVQISAIDLACCTNCLLNSFCKGGGSSYDALEHYVNYGLVSGGENGYGCKPYQLPKDTQTITCSKKCSNSNYGKKYDKDLHFGKSVYRVSFDVSQIQKEIMTNGPVNAQINDNGWHTIRIIGWGVNDNFPYWLVANSMGTGYGEQGFEKIRRGKNEKSIEEFVIAGLPLEN